MNNNRAIQYTFLAVYAAVSVATFYHSAWGFATLQGAMPAPGWTVAFVGWWLIGGLMAFAVDVGMGVIVFGLISGWQAGWLIAALVVLAFASGYTQVIYAAHHAAAYGLGAVPEWLNFLEAVLDARVIVLPLMLPAFALIYAFAAKLQPVTDLSTDYHEIAEPVTVQPVQLLNDTIERIPNGLNASERAAWAIGQWPDLSNQQIADKVNAGKTTVHNARKNMTNGH